MSDIRDAWRSLKATPIVSAAAIVSLALGIGATSAIFSILDAAVLRPLPVRNPHELVTISTFPYRVWEEIRRRDLFAGDFAWAWNQFNTANGGPAEFVDGLFVSGRFFDVLGVAPYAGRLLTEADDRDGAPSGPVTVISHRFWQQRFGGAPDAIGRSITLERRPYTIVGVMPPSFSGVNIGLPFDVAVPVSQNPQIRMPFSGPRFTVMARLKAGQTAEAAMAALRAAQPEIRLATMPAYQRAEDRERYLRAPMTVTPAPAGTSVLKGRYERPLWALLAVVGVVLLIACANIATLLMARAMTRRHELGVRLAIGASRIRLARLMLVESAMLAAAGTALGLALAHSIAPLLVRQLSTQAYTIFLDLSFNARVFGFTSAIACATVLLFGIAPAWKAMRAEPLEALRRERGSAGDGRFGFGNVMLAGQVALSVLLVAAAGLFLRSYAALAGRDVGFERDRVLVVGVNAGSSATRQEGRPALFERVREAVSSVPGVAGAGVSLAMPAGNVVFTPEIQLPDGEPLPFGMSGVYGHFVSPGWFEALGTRIIAGRDFVAADSAAAPLAAIVNETFAHRFLGGTSPLGQTLFELQDPLPPRAVQVVGVAQDAMYRVIREPAPPTVYFPIGQMNMALAASVNLSVRAGTGPPAALSRAIADAIGSIDRDISLTFRSLTDQVNSQYSQDRILAQLSGFFGVLALILAALGLYGLTSYILVRRRMEIGIRLALGAEPRAVVRLVLARIAFFVVLGAAIGTVLSLWVSRFAASLLFGVQPGDPATLGAAVSVLAAVCAFAAWWPARRAGRIDPATLLRDI
jgi:predicted permease